MLQQIVNPAPTSTSLVSSLNPSQFNQAVTFTAVVTSGAGIPTGSVNFFDGSTLLGGGILAAGTATFSTSALAAGAHNVTAAYVASPNFSGSISNVVIQTVTSPAPPPNALAMHLHSSDNPSSYGEPVEFRVTLISTAQPAATGTVTFTADGATIGTCVLHHSFGLVSRCGVRYGSLNVGTTTITATYNGDSHYAQQSATIQQVVLADPTETILRTSLNPSTESKEVVLSAFVVSRDADDHDHDGQFDRDRDHNGYRGKKPTGTVTFYCDGAAIGTYELDSAEAHMKYLFAKPGSYKMMAVYSGSDTKQPSTSRVEIQIVKAHRGGGPHDRD